MVMATRLEYSARQYIGLYRDGGLERYRQAARHLHVMESRHALGSERDIDVALYGQDNRTRVIVVPGSTPRRETGMCQRKGLA